MSDVTHLPEAVCRGDLRVNTLQPKALVNEAWLRLAGDQNQKWEGRSYFFAAAAGAMRRILIDRARRKRAVRHGSDQRVDFQKVDLACPTPDDELLALNEALDELAAKHLRVLQAPAWFTAFVPEARVLARS